MNPAAQTALWAYPTGKDIMFTIEQQESIFFLCRVLTISLASP
jgi:hypothetical protein